mgnify:CR=1 FL=1
MGKVTVRVNGRDYQMACEDGEEEHLVHLAEFINRHVNDLVETVGQVGEARLLLMAALVIADELADAYRKIDDLGGTAGDEPLAGLAARLEGIAARLESL